jgi:IS605 OrfB family transposase
MISYSVKLKIDEGIKSRIVKTLESHSLAFNEASSIKFNKKLKNNIVDLHREFYTKFRKNNPESLADYTIHAENECLSAYRSVKSNKHKIDKPIEKRKLSCRLNKHLYSLDLSNKTIKLSCVGGKRVLIKLDFYSKIEELFDKYPVADPLIYIKDNDLYLAFSFKINESPHLINKTAIGVDLGIKRIASISDGRILQDKHYLKNKRKLRFLKRQLKSTANTKKSRSAKKHLKKIRRKEANQTRDFTHRVCKEILKTNANTIILEDLTRIKNPKNKNKKKYQNLNKISQVPFFKIRTFLTYKARLQNKEVEVINPAYTSQTCSQCHKIGSRNGESFKCPHCGFEAHADVNAAKNIGAAVNLPEKSVKGHLAPNQV